MGATAGWIFSNGIGIGLVTILTKQDAAEATAGRGIAGESSFADVTGEAILSLMALF